MRHVMVKADGEGLDEGTGSLCGNQGDGEHKWEVYKDREPPPPAHVRMPVPASAFPEGSCQSTPEQCQAS